VLRSELPFKITHHGPSSRQFFPEDLPDVGAQCLADAVCCWVIRPHFSLVYPSSLDAVLIYSSDSLIKRYQINALTKVHRDLSPSIYGSIRLRLVFLSIRDRFFYHHVGAEFSGAAVKTDSGDLFYTILLHASLPSSTMITRRPLPRLPT